MSFERRWVIIKFLNLHGVAMAFAVSVVQLEVDHQQPEQNRAAALHLCTEAIDRGARLVLLPEAALTDLYGEAAPLAETIPGPSSEAFQGIAGRAVIALPILEKKNDQIFSACALINSTGVIAVVRRTHLFRDPLGLDLFDEHQLLSPGDELSIVETNGVRIGVALGFDAQFPEVFRTLALKGADIILCALNCVEPDVEFLRAMARCNHIPIAVANRLGFKPAYPSQPEFSATTHAFVQDRRGNFLLRCRGGSLVIGPNGKIESRAAAFQPPDAADAPERTKIPGHFFQEEQLVTASFQFEDLCLERLIDPLLAARRPDLYLNK